jgi:D-lactate dehydrogenase
MHTPLPQDLKQTIVFEWSDYEQFVFAKEEMRWAARFEPGKFNVNLAKGYPNVSIFVDSKISNKELDELARNGTRYIAIRSAGHDMLDAEYAKSIGLGVYFIASYSPESIAEHAFALLLNLVRKLNIERRHHAGLQHIRTIQSMGTTLKGKKIGLYGVGRIGSIMAKIADGFSMEVGFYDKYIDRLPAATKVTSLNELFQKCDVVSIHVPLTAETKYSVNSEILAQAKPGLILLNTARGDVVDPQAALHALDKGILAGLGIDVWDSGKVDDKFDSRLYRDNVIQTHHIAFFTYEAVREMIKQTILNLQGEGDSKNLL